MNSNNQMVNINNTNFRTILVPEESIDAVRQKLGNEFTWNHDEKSNKLYLMHKNRGNTDFLTEYSEEIQANTGFDDVPAQLKNRWDD